MSSSVRLASSRAASPSSSTGSGEEACGLPVTAAALMWLSAAWSRAASACMDPADRLLTRAGIATQAARLADSGPDRSQLASVNSGP